MSKGGLLFLTVCLAVATLSRFTLAQPKDATEPSREQLLTQISILQDHIKKLEADTKD